MNKVRITDEVMRGIFWLRASELRVMGTYKTRPKDEMLYKLTRLGYAKCFRPRRGCSEHWTMVPEARKLVDEIIRYEEENPRYSAEEGPSALLHGGTLFSWSHRTAIYEIENLRRMRQRTEERKAKRSGRTGCAKTRCRAEPRPKMAICVDACRDHGKVR